MPANPVNPVDDLELQLTVPWAGRELFIEGSEIVISADEFEVAMTLDDWDYSKRNSTSSYEYSQTGTSDAEVSALVYCLSEFCHLRRLSLL